MLMKVVLPAPLVPIRPTTESLSMAALMSLAAVTAPKFLLRPCASRIAAISGRLAPPEQRPQAVRQEHDDRQQRAAEHHLPGIGRDAEGHRLDDAEDERAEERRDDVASAREDGDEDELARGRPVGHFRVYMPDGRGGERAAQSRERRGDHV